MATNRGMNEAAMTGHGVVRSRRFATAFAGLPAYRANRDFLARLGGYDDGDGPMVGDASPEEDAPVPAGIAFFGQFVDHEITFDPTSDLGKRTDPAALRNFKTPALDLDSVYGAGPEAHPYLYDDRDDAKLYLPTDPADPVAPDDEDRERAVRFGAGDVQRNDQNVAVTNDPRNDENLIISQLLLAFVKLHNRVVDYLRSGAGSHLWEGEPEPDDPEAVREEATRVVRWHYQWLVVEEFLPRVCDGSVLDAIAAGDRRVVTDPDSGVAIPVEFAGAAYRYGHSQIRDRYRVNDRHGEVPFFPTPDAEDEDDGGMPDLADLPVDAADLPFDPGDEPIEAMEKPDGVGETTGDDEPRSLAGFGAVREDLVVDWRHFFAYDSDGRSADDPGTTVQPARTVDAKLPPSLFFLPFIEEEGVTSLAARNLLRGRTFGLPSGQAVAAKLGARPLSNEALPMGDGQSYADVLRRLGRGVDDEAPLWLYVLCEADAQGNGARLGAVGSRIVGEVITGLARAAESTYLDAADWRPTLPRLVSHGERPGDDPARERPYRFADLLEFATGPSPDGVAIRVDVDGAGEAPDVANSTGGEAVVLDHDGDGALDLTGYRLDFDDGQRRTFGEDGVGAPTLASGEELVVYTGDATPADADLDPGVRTLALGYDGAVVNDDGTDTVTLVSDLGVVSDWEA
jgi:hypothetical protein